MLGRSASQGPVKTEEHVRRRMEGGLIHVQACRVRIRFRVLKLCRSKSALTDSFVVA